MEGLSPFQGGACGHNTSLGCDPLNACFNRFQNVIPSDSHLVHLKNPPQYINASYVHHCSFIATQAPLPHTISHFWQMIFETNATAILSLTPLLDQYWPSTIGSNITYSFFNVLLESEEMIQSNSIIVRTFILSISNESTTSFNPGSPCTPGPSTVCASDSLPFKRITHIHYLGWPDGLAPRCINEWNTVLDLVLSLGSPLAPLKPPLIVHCLAGVGRTACAIATLVMLDCARKGSLAMFNLDEFIVDLRRCRCPLMVENEDQYSFLVNFKNCLSCNDVNDNFITDSYEYLSCRFD
ncbi:hypothetical protein P9112_002001 [Eukaryota sp. TZLM1-RC]